MKLKLLLLLLLGILVMPSQAQNDLLNLLDQEITPERIPVDATFKSTRVINCHSIERMQAKDLELHISHRFGPISSGFTDFYGLDESSSYISLEYGITNWLEAGVGRATVDKYFNGFIKLSPIRQSKGKHAMPVSASLYLAAMTTNQDYEDPTWSVDGLHRKSYVTQLLVARKFAPWLSLQLSPTYVHRNMVATAQDPNGIFAMGMGGRMKFTARTAFSFEYFLVKDRDLMTGAQRYNPLSLGLDFETGSHVFQIFVTNSFSILENGFLGETTESWTHKGLHFGFNISRVFTLGKKKS